MCVDDSQAARSLDHLGAAAVLSTRRHAAPPIASGLPMCELDEADLVEDNDDDGDAVATQRRAALDPTCDAFMKIR